MEGMMVKYAPKVLIIDDDLIVCEGLSKILQNTGYQVSGIASSGRKAIELAMENPPDLMLMDAKLGGDLDGIETTLIIQGELDLSIPTVFLSDINVNEFPCLRLIDHCTYPNESFSEAELLDCIEKVLGLPSLILTPTL